MVRCQSQQINGLSVVSTDGPATASLCPLATGSGELDLPSTGAPTRLARDPEELAFATLSVGASSSSGPAAEDALGFVSAKLSAFPALPDSSTLFLGVDGLDPGNFSGAVLRRAFGLDFKAAGFGQVISE